MNRRTIFITGGNRGLGFASAKRLAKAGHRLIVTARDQGKASAMASRLERDVPGSQVEVRTLELTSFASVRQLAERTLADEERIDVLVHNAGMLFPPPERTLTEDGIETSLQVHAVAPLLLTRSLLPAMSRPSQIWGVGSSLHYPDARGPKVDLRLEDPNLDANYHPKRAYKNGKLALLWVAYEFERRVGGQGVHFNVVSPGFVPETAAAGAPKTFMRFALKSVLPHMPFATSLDESADGLATHYGETPLDAAGGRYFRNGEPVDSSEQSRDEAQATQFWRWACERAGIDEGIPA